MQRCPRYLHLLGNRYIVTYLKCLPVTSPIESCLAGSQPGTLFHHPKDLPALFSVNGADDGDDIMLSKLAFFKDAVKEPSASGELKRMVCARLETMVKFDLKR